MKRIRIICILALFAGVAAMDVHAQRRGYGDELFDIFMLNWIESDKAINEQDMLSSYNALSAVRGRYRGDELAFYNKFILSWTTGRTIDATTLLRTFNLLLRDRASYSGADREYFDKFVLGWIESGTGGSSGGGGRRGGGRGTDADAIISSFKAMTAVRGRYRGDDQFFFDEFVLAWVASSKNVNDAEILRSFNLLNRTRNQTRGDERTFFDQFMLYWIGSERRVDENAMTSTFNTLAAARGRR